MIGIFDIIFKNPSFLFRLSKNIFINKESPKYIFFNENSPCNPIFVNNAIFYMSLMLIISGL